MFSVIADDNRCLKKIDKLLYTERRGSCKMASFSDVNLKAP